MLGVDLCKLLATAVVFKIQIHHLISHLSGTNSMNFKHLVKYRVKFNLKYFFLLLQCLGSKHTKL